MRKARTLSGITDIPRSDISTYLPPSAGLLPYWYLFTATAGLYHTIQNFMVIWQTKEIYSGKADEGELDLAREPCFHTPLLLVIGA